MCRNVCQEVIWTVNNLHETVLIQNGDLFIEKWIPVGSNQYGEECSCLNQYRCTEYSVYGELSTGHIIIIIYNTLGR